MDTIQPNLFYLSGPHGSGKSSLGKKLTTINPEIVMPDLYSRNIKFYTEPTYRQMLKIAGRAIENFEYLQIAKDNPEKVILGNRCIYDVKAYNWVYKSRGWITKNTYQLELTYGSAFFREENKEPLAIIVNPGFDVVKKHLEKRWAESGKKWHEEDMEYASLACKAYEIFRYSDRVLYVDREVDLESNKGLDDIIKWITASRKQYTESEKNNEEDAEQRIHFYIRTH